MSLVATLPTYLGDTRPLFVSEAFEDSLGYRVKSALTSHSCVTLNPFAVMMSLELKQSIKVRNLKFVNFFVFLLALTREKNFITKHSTENRL